MTPMEVGKTEKTKKRTGIVTSNTLLNGLHLRGFTQSEVRLDSNRIFLGSSGLIDAAKITRFSFILYARKLDLAEPCVPSGDSERNLIV